MIAVSDTSPIVNRAAIGRLELLEKLYGRLRVPQAVFDEIAAGPGLPGFAEVQSQQWIETVAVSDRHLVAGLRVELDRSEAEAIVLALERNADLLLMDERRGRRVARRLGLRFIGVLGILIDAKRQKHIPAVKPNLDDLMVKAGFWINRSLYERILQAAGE